MAFQEYSSARPEFFVTLGGHNKKGEKNPTLIEGYYLGRTVGVNTFDPTKPKVTFMLKTPKGIAGVNGNANLITRITEAEGNFKAREGSNAEGVLVRLTCTGEIPTKKGNAMKTFSVSFDAQDRIEVQANVDAEFAEDETDVEEDAQDDGLALAAAGKAAAIVSAGLAADRKAQALAIIAAAKNKSR